MARVVVRQGFYCIDIHQKIYGILDLSMCGSYPPKLWFDTIIPTLPLAKTPERRYRLVSTDGFYCLLRKTESEIYTISNVESQVVTLTCLVTARSLSGDRTPTGGVPRGKRQWPVLTTINMPMSMTMLVMYTIVTTCCTPNLLINP